MNVTSWYKWSASQTKKEGLRIRRYRFVNEKKVWESLPKNRYCQLPHTQITQFIEQLNLASKAKEAVESKSILLTDYNSKFILENFKRSLLNRADSKSHINSLVGGLQNHTFKFFAFTNNILEWPSYEAEFGSYLLNKSFSTSHLKMIIQVTNRYIKFVCKAYNMNPFVLEPLSNLKLKTKSNLHTLREDRRKYLTEQDFKLISDSLSKSSLDIWPAVKLGYSFGLRCSEVLGLELQDVFEDCLGVNRQLVLVKPKRITGTLKSGVSRSVRYWFTTPNETYLLISNLVQMHPDTLSRKFLNEMKRIGLPFKFHDLRRTFITRALRHYHYRDVQMSAGHKDLKTTMIYAQDDRQLLRKQFKPELSKISVV